MYSFDFSSILNGFRRVGPDTLRFREKKLVGERGSLFNQDSKKGRGQGLGTESDFPPETTGN